MPRRKRADGAACTAAAKVRVLSLGAHLDENSMDDAMLDADLEDYGSPAEGSGSPHHPLQRNAANARERARMRVLSRAFCRLKTTLPWVPADTKLSKLDTLRLATSYIAHLREVLLLPAGEAPASHAHAPVSNPLNLTWPFTFPQPGGSGAPLAGAEPWIARGAAAAASSRCGQPGSGRTAANPGGSANSGSGGCGSASSGASSGADDDLAARDEDEQHLQRHDHGLDGNEQALNRRGLSGGRLVGMPQLPQLHCHDSYQPQEDYHDHSFLRYATDACIERPSAAEPQLSQRLCSARLV